MSLAAEGWTIIRGSAGIFEEPSVWLVGEENMLFKKLFQMLVVGGAVIGTMSGCATTSTESDSQGAKSPSPPPRPPPSGMGGGVRGW